MKQNEQNGIEAIRMNKIPSVGLFGLYALPIVMY